VFFDLACTTLIRTNRFSSALARREDHKKVILETQPTRDRAPLFEIASVLVRFDHVARFIVNANHGITAFDSCRRTESPARHCRLNPRCVNLTYREAFFLTPPLWGWQNPGRAKLFRRLPKSST
jgi:hypothetical protein